MSSVKTLNANAEVMNRSAALFMNINAAKGLHEVMKTNFGPKGTIKMLVGGAGGRQHRRFSAPAHPAAGGAAEGMPNACVLQQRRTRLCLPRFLELPAASGALIRHTQHHGCCAANRPRQLLTMIDACPACRRHQVDKGRQCVAAGDANPKPNSSHDCQDCSGPG